MKKILVTSLLMCNILCIASDTELYENDTRAKKCISFEKVQKLGMEINPLNPEEFYYNIKSFSASMPHHIQRYLQDSDKYNMRINQVGVFKLLKVYDGTDRSNLKKIKLENEISDVQKFVRLINKLSIWPSTYSFSEKEKKATGFDDIICWHVVVGFESQFAKDLYYGQKIVRRAQALTISNTESETNSISQVQVESNQN